MKLGMTAGRNVGLDQERARLSAKVGPESRVSGQEARHTKRPFHASGLGADGGDLGAGGRGGAQAYLEEKAWQAGSGEETLWQKGEGRGTSSRRGGRIRFRPGFRRGPSRWVSRGPAVGKIWCQRLAYGAEGAFSEPQTTQADHKTSRESESELGKNQYSVIFFISAEGDSEGSDPASSAGGE